jgi:hypothetical protein
MIVQIIQGSSIFVANIPPTALLLICMFMQKFRFLGFLWKFMLERRIAPALITKIHGINLQ